MDNKERKLVNRYDVKATEPIPGPKRRYHPPFIGIGGTFSDLPAPKIKLKARKD